MKNSILHILCIAFLLIAVVAGTITFLPKTTKRPDLHQFDNTDSYSHPEHFQQPHAQSEPEIESEIEPEPGNSYEPAVPSKPEEISSEGAAPEPELQARQITDGLTAVISDGTDVSPLLDGNYSTRLIFKTEAVVTISSIEDIFSIYIIWGLPPAEWTLCGTQVQTGGENGFIHEYVSLLAPGGELELHLPSTGAVLSEIYVFTEGLPPSWVQVWLPPHNRAELLVLPTHADDEHLFFAGVLPYYSGERNYRVQVAYMTNHWNEPPRTHELLDGLWTVGIRNYPIISHFNDRYASSLSHAQSIYGFDNFVNYQIELLRRFKPLVVVGHDLNGEYGHGVHMLNAHALVAAVDRAAGKDWDSESYEQFGIWNTPKLYLHLYPENAIMMDWSIPLERFGGATAYEMAVDGYDAHKSQHRWAFAVPRHGRASGHKFGLVRTLVGWDYFGGDLFENLLGELG